MKQVPEKPVRLVDLPREQDLGQVARLIRSAASAPSEDTPAVKWRIRNTLHQRRQRRSRTLRFALAATLMFVAGGVASAFVQPLLRSRTLAQIFSHAGPDTVAPAGHGPRRGSRPQPSLAPSTSAYPAAPSVPPGVTAKTQVAPRRVVASRLAAESARQPRPEAQPAFPSQALVPAPVMPAPSEAAAVPASAMPPSEHALIATALHKLRTSHEPAAALAALDEYRLRFPSGELTPEAVRLRAEALLRLGRKSTVLEDLDRSLSGQTPASDERVVLRGELRAAAGRWRAALADFDAVVRAHPTSPSSDADADDERASERMERALWGRASARSHVGDDAGARADLREYLRRFPDGRFADQVGRLLDGHR